MRAPDMTSVRISAYDVPIEAHFQPVLFDPGTPARKHEDHLSYRCLEKRLSMLRKVKLELEESNINKDERIEHLTKRLEVVNSAMYGKGETYKLLYKSEQALGRARLRMKELTARVDEVQNDYDRLHGEVDKYRKEFRCSTCKQVKKVECFGKDVDQPTGYDIRCRLCLREKTKRWRAAKKLLQQ